jgi:hypothetical protein
MVADICYPNNWAPAKRYNMTRNEMSILSFLQQRSFLNVCDYVKVIDLANLAHD